MIPENGSAPLQTLPTGTEPNPQKHRRFSWVNVASGLFFVLLLSGFPVWRWYSLQNPEATTCLPDGAFAVLEVSDPVITWQRFINRPGYAYLLRNVPGMHHTEVGFMAVKLLLKKHTDLAGFSEAKKLCISMHQTGGQTTAALFALRLEKETDRIVAAHIVNEFKNKPGYRFYERSFNGVLISEIKAETGTETFSYIFHNHIFAGSFTPFLVEDAIRKLNNIPFWDPEAFIFTTPHAISQNSESTDILPGVTVTIHYKALQALLSAVGFNPDNFPLSDAGFSAFGASGKVGLQLSKAAFGLQGSTQAPEGTLLNLFCKQQAQPFRLAAFLPSNAAYVYRTSCSRPEVFAKALFEARLHNPSDPLQPYLISNGGFAEKVQKLAAAASRETALCIPESTGPSGADRLLLLATENSAQLAEQLQELALVPRTGPDSLYNEITHGHKLQQLGCPDVPALLFGPSYGNFGTCFVLSLKGAAAVSNNPNLLKKLASDLANGENLEETIGLGAAVSSESVKDESQKKHCNVQVFVNFERIRNLSGLKNLPGAGLLPAGLEGLLIKTPILQAGFTWQKAEEFTTLFQLASRSGVQQQVNRGPELKEVYNTYLSNALLDGPKLLRNPENRSLEVLLHDSLHNLILLNKAGEPVFRKKLSEALISDISTVDLTGKGTPQYFFSTLHTLQLLNRKGDSIAPFPLRLPKNLNPTQALPVDYGTGKNFRFMVADKDSGLYLFDEKGKTLEGWAPRSLQGAVASAPQYLRIGSKDCFLVAEKNGLVHLFSRRGFEYPGFPLNYGSRLSNQLFVNPGISFETGSLSILTDAGEVLTHNFHGKLLNRYQLYRPSKESKFKLCPDPSGKSFAVVRRDLDSVTLFNSDMQRMFSKVIGRKNSFRCQYYNFGAGNEVFAFSIPEASKTTLYNPAGAVIAPSPFESTQRISLLYSDALRTYFMYRINGHRCVAETFRRVYK